MIMLHILYMQHATYIREKNTKQSLIEVGVALIYSPEFSNTSCPWMPGWHKCDSIRENPTTTNDTCTIMQQSA